MPDRLNLPRDVLSKIAGGNQLAIRQLENVFSMTNGFPSTIEEAAALAGSALAVAQAATNALLLLTEALSQLESGPAPVPATELDDTAPRVHLGTISSQNADAIEVTGGTAAGIAITASTVDGTPIGATTPAAGSFTTLAASGQITSTVATGAAPLVIASTTKVNNLYVARAASADSAGAASTANSLTNPTSFPAAATDLATVITLANALRAAATAKGL